MQEKIRVIYDHQIFIMQKCGGVSRYFTELFSRLKMFDDIEIEIFTDGSSNLYYANICGRDVKKYSKIQKKLKLYMYGLMMIGKVVSAELKGNGYDIIHATWYHVAYIKVLRKILGNRCPKIVITIHDLIPFIYNEKKMKKIAKGIQNAISICDGIICVSKNTKNDLLRFFPELEDMNIPVVYHGTSIECTETATDVIPDYDYVLYVGKRTTYKNFGIFIQAMSKLRRIGIDIKAICIGGGELTKEEEKNLREYDISDSVFHIEASDNELAMLYRNARCFIYPSCYEGFGIPILEAFKLECPTIVSKASCFEEIAQNGALYFDKDNADELTERIKSILESDIAKEELIKKANSRLSAFSWDLSAKQTKEYYNTIISKPRMGD